MIFMVFLDSNIFLIDRFFPRDKNYKANKQFLGIIDLKKIKAALPFFTLLEICGIASFNLSSDEQEKWLYSFSEVYPVEILDPFDPPGKKTDSLAYFSELPGYILKRMTVGDAIFLREAELYGAEAIVTWNKKHFSDKTAIPVFTPAEYI
ncbi:MAG: type II toxin-antitoxin system VapC family toxin [Desulfotomaculales bacterium]